MKTIWKEKLVSVKDRGSLFNLKLPKGAKIVLIGPDPNGEECVWFEFERKNAENKVPRVLEIFGTGHLIPPLSTHLLSFKSGEFMWHVYDHGEVLPALGAR